MYRTCIHVDTCSTHPYTYIHVLYMHTRTHMGHTCTVHAYTYTQLHTRTHMGYSTCIHVYACMAHVCTCMHVQYMYMYIVSRASYIFPRMRMRVRKWAGEGKEKYVRAQLPGFRDSLVCAECLPRVHVRNDY